MGAGVGGLERSVGKEGADGRGGFDEEAVVVEATDQFAAVVEEVFAHHGAGNDVPFSEGELVEDVGEVGFVGGHGADYYGRKGPWRRRGRMSRARVSLREKKT